MTDATVNLAELAQQIAAALNDDATVTLESEGFAFEAPTDDDAKHYVRLVHPDGRAFSLNTTWSGAGKLHIYGTYPSAGNGYSSPRDWGAIPYGEQAPSVNVSATREPAAIARDIARRFLPAYTTIYRACVVKQHERETYRATVNGTAEQLAALIPGAELCERDGTKSVHFYTSSHGYGDATPYGDSVNMDLRSLPLELARRIVALIGKTYRKSLSEESEG